MPNFKIASSVLTLRPRKPRDDKFLRLAYESSRDVEFKDVQWPNDAAREHFFHSQFDLQEKHFNSIYDTLDYDIIEHNRKPIGRLVLSWESDHLHCVDIIIIAKLRKQQIGSTIMNSIIKEVDKRGITASLMFEKWKPYLEAFYEKYGFKKTKDYEAHSYMQREKKA